MKTRTIIFLLGLVLVSFFVTVHATELDDLLKNKEVEYVGVCRLDANGMLVFDDKTTKTSPECVVGAPKGETDLKTIMLFDKKGPVKVLEYSLRGRKQRTVWSRGSV